MNKNKKITLSEVEQAICRGVARSRYKNARNAGVENRKIGKQSDEETDLQGFAAEFAFCRLFNLFPDFTIHPRSMYDDEGDAKFPSGLIVDVKSTKYETGRLVAAKWKKSESNVVDAYALMTGTFPEFTFRGFMHKKEFLREERLGNLGHGEHFIAQQYELKELSEIEDENRSSI